MLPPLKPVVPAKAGTHNPFPEDWAAALPHPVGHGVWGPAFAGTTGRLRPSVLYQVVTQLLLRRKPRPAAYAGRAFASASTSAAHDGAVSSPTTAPMMRSRAAAERFLTLLSLNFFTTEPASMPLWE